MVAGAGLSLARQSGAGALNTIYAEDGSVFLGASYVDSAFTSITTPYAGYLHFVPRVLSELVSVFPVSWAAAGLSIAAAVATGLLALLVYACTRDYLAPWGRLLAAAVVVLVPVGQDELPNSIANLHWPMLYALFWVLIAKRLHIALAVGSVLLISLSDLLVLVYVPLALWFWWRKRDQRSLLLAAALLVGLAAQAAAVLFGPSGRELHPEPVKWAPWYVIRAVPESVLGQRWFGSTVDGRWLALAAIAWLLVAAAVAVAFRAARARGVTGVPGRRMPVAAANFAGRAAAGSAVGGEGGRTGRDASAAAGGAVGDVGGAGGVAGRVAGMWRDLTSGPARDARPLSGWRLAALAGVYSVAVYALPVALSGQATPRYAAASAMLLVTAAAALFLAPTTVTASLSPVGDSVLGGDRVAISVGGLRGLRAGAVLLAFCAVVWALNFRVPNERSNGPLWTDELAKACAGNAAEAEVAIVPAGWEVRVPCRR